jgi:hypothetical protein
VLVGRSSRHWCPLIGPGSSSPRRAEALGQAVGDPDQWGSANGTKRKSVSEVVPAPEIAFILLPPRPLEGRFVRRRVAGWGAAPAGLVRKPGTRAAPGLRPGPLRVPARSWLTTEDIGSSAKARPGQPNKCCHGAPRGARASSKDASHRICAFRRAIPCCAKGEIEQNPGAIRVAATSAHALTTPEFASLRRKGEPKRPCAWSQR